MNDERITIRLNHLLKDEIAKYCSDNDLTFSRFFKEMAMEKLQIRIKKEYSVEKS